MSPAPFNQVVTPISRVEICLNYFLGPITLRLPLLTIVFQSSRIKTQTPNHLRLLAWSCPLTLSSLSSLLSLLLREYLLIQRRLTRRLLHLYNLPTILQLQSRKSLLPPQLDYSSQFRSVKTINLNLQTNFLRLAPSYLTFDPFSRAPIVSNFSPISLLLDANIAANIMQTTHAEQNDPASIRIYNTVTNENSPHGK